MSGWIHASQLRVGTSLLLWTRVQEVVASFNALTLSNELIRGNTRAYAPPSRAGGDDGGSDNSPPTTTGYLRDEL